MQRTSMSLVEQISVNQLTSSGYEAIKKRRFDQNDIEQHKGLSLFCNNV